LRRIIKPFGAEIALDKWPPGANFLETRVDYSGLGVCVAEPGGFRQFRLPERNLAHRHFGKETDQ
jgi:hypothetical protein